MVNVFIHVCVFKKKKYVSETVRRCVCACIHVFVCALIRTQAVQLSTTPKKQQATNPNVFSYFH